MCGVRTLQGTAHLSLDLSRSRENERACTIRTSGEFNGVRDVWALGQVETPDSSKILVATGEANGQCRLCAAARCRTQLVPFVVAAEADAHLRALGL